MPIRRTAFITACLLCATLGPATGDMRRRDSAEARPARQQPATIPFESR